MRLHAAYMGRCRMCHDMTIAVPDNPDRPADVARTLYETLRDGGVYVERVDIKLVVQQPWCVCDEDD